MEDLFAKIIADFAAAGIENPRYELRLLLAHILRVSPAEINLNMSASFDLQDKLLPLCRQRISHKPLDKIVGYRDFYKDTFLVTKDVLSPRPDTEIIVEKTLEYLQGRQQPKILDLGTGSGCIICSLLHEMTKAKGTAVDISASAVKVAEQNARKIGLSERIKFVAADWFEADFPVLIADKFDVIGSNPPYIASADIATLQPEVRDYDPHLALDGGIDGLESYARIIEIAPLLLNEDGWLIFESGYGQAGKIAEIGRKRGFIVCETAKDLAGIERCVIMKKDVAKIKKVSI